MIPRPGRGEVASSVQKKSLASVNVPDAYEILSGFRQKLKGDLRVRPEIFSLLSQMSIVGTFADFTSRRSSIPVERLTTVRSCDFSPAAARPRRGHPGWLATVPGAAGHVRHRLTSFRGHPRMQVPSPQLAAGGRMGCGVPMSIRVNGRFSTRPPIWVPGPPSRCQYTTITGVPRLNLFQAGAGF